MNDDFFKKFISSVLYATFISFIIGFVLVVILEATVGTSFVLSILFFPFIFYSNLKGNLSVAVAKKDKEVADAILLVRGVEEKISKKDKQIEILETTLKEKTAGFPTLHQSIDYFHSLMDKYLSDRLINKTRPAIRSAEEVREQSRRRREAEKKQKITQSIIEFYEQLEPSLVEYKNEEFGNLDEIIQEWTDEEKKDPVTLLLNKDEYRRLPDVEKNQLALDRYWKRPHSKWQIGIMYERYIGYLYEKDGYDVIYHGVKEGKRDLGRDLIAQKGNNFVVIQCKYWNQFKTIFENDIFQFFGTFFQYKKANKNKRVKGIFYATTNVSDLARDFADELGIELKTNYKMDREYPCIKCNTSQSGKSKIYHLPFDQQYDNVKIEKEKGQFYCRTTKEAEDKGFRRAWRWRGVNSD